MKSFFVCLLVLPFVACSASSSRKHERDESSEVDYEQPLKVQKVTPEAINPEDREQDKQLSLESLAHRIGMEGFKQLPLAADLKVFELSRFPQSSLGKADALVLVFKMATFVLAESEFYGQLMGIVFDEAVALVREDLDAYLRFTSTSGFYLSVDLGLLVAHFVKKGDIGALLDLRFNWPIILTDKKFHLDCLSREEFFDVAPAFVKHFTLKPDDYRRFFAGHFGARSCLLLLWSELPLPQMEDLVFPEVSELSNEVFLKSIWEILLYYRMDALPVEEMAFLKRVFSFLENTERFYSLQAQREVGKWSAHFSDLKKFTTLRSRVARWNEPDYQQYLKENDRFKVFCFTMLILSGKHEEALKYLPRKAHPQTLIKILEVPSFCSLLAKRSPIWIRQKFGIKMELVFQNRDIFFAFFGIESFAEFMVTASLADFNSLSWLMFTEGSVEEVEDFLSRLDPKSLPNFYNVLLSLKSKISGPRLAEIIKIFVEMEKKLGPGGSLKCTGFQEIGTEASLRVLELIGVEEYYGRLEGDSGKEEAWRFFHSSLFLSVLKSSHFFASLVPLRVALLERFSDFDGIVSNCIYTPTALENGSQFFSLDRIQFLKNIIKFAADFHRHNFVDCFVVLIALSRAWMAADWGVTQYEGVDYCRLYLDLWEPSSEGYCNCLYASLLKKGKAALQHVFAFIHETNNPTIQL